MPRVIPPLKCGEGPAKFVWDLAGFCLEALVLLSPYLKSILEEVSCSLISFPALFRLCARSWTV